MQEHPDTEDREVRESGPMAEAAGEAEENMWPEQDLETNMAQRCGLIAASHTQEGRCGSVGFETVGFLWGWCGDSQVRPLWQAVLGRPHRLLAPGGTARPHSKRLGELVTVTDPP